MRSPVTAPGSTPNELPSYVLVGSWACFKRYAEIILAQNRFVMKLPTFADLV